VTVCNYPDCDGGPATGYCHVSCRAMKTHTLTLAALLLASTLTGCVSSQRFASPAQQSEAVPQAAPPQVRSPVRGNLGGPYTREREDAGDY
jgi:hypothetical protein